jgi:uncharacterized membrane protein
MPIELITLRLIHVLCGIFWVGAGLYSTLFIVPAMAKAGPAAGPIMEELGRRKLFTVMPLAAVLTMLTGLRLLWIVSGGFAPSYFGSPSGATFAIAGALAIIGFFFGMFVLRPGQMKMGALAAQIGAASAEQKPALQAELEKVRKASAIGTAAAMVMLVLSVVGMAIARYL